MIVINECFYKGEQCGRRGGCYVNGVKCLTLERLGKI